jgi:hypothetical protein
MTDGDASKSPRTRGIPIDGLARAADRIGGVRRRDLVPGDRVIVSTRNSIYSLTACADGSFMVSGGWFERHGLAAVQAEVVGCTVGGRAVFTDHVAAPGMFIEFADGLQTTRVRTVQRITDRPAGRRPDTESPDRR